MSDAVKQTTDNFIAFYCADAGKNFSALSARVLNIYLGSSDSIQIKYSIYYIFNQVAQLHAILGVLIHILSRKIPIAHTYRSMLDATMGVLFN